MEIVPAEEIEPVALVTLSPPDETERLPDATEIDPDPFTVRVLPDVTVPVIEAVTEPPVLTVMVLVVEKAPPAATVTGALIVAVAA
jgi:hypothetical protein